MVEGTVGESPLVIDVRSNTMVLTMSRPSRRNAVNLEMLQAFQAAFTDARAQDIRVVLLTGAAPSFSAGADLAGVKEDDLKKIFTERQWKLVLERDLPDSRQNWEGIENYHRRRLKGEDTDDDGGEMILDFQF